MVEPWVSLASTPRSRQPLARLPAGHQRRVDVDAGPQAAARARRRRPCRPARAGRRAAARRARPSAAGTRRWPAAGPPRCRPRRPAGCRRRSSRARPAGARRARRAFAATAETGTMPPPSALPSTYMSGTTPSWSQAKVRAGAAQPGLDLVGDQQHVALVQTAPHARRSSPPAAPARPPRPGSARAARPPCSASIAAASAARSP